MKSSTSREKYSVAHIVTTNPQHPLVWRSILFVGGLTVKLLLIPWMHQSPHLTECNSVNQGFCEGHKNEQPYSQEEPYNKKRFQNEWLIKSLSQNLVRNTLLQYTLPSLHNQFPWTTRKSKIVEKSIIVEIFASTIFSTAMEFDCTYLPGHGQSHKRLEGTRRKEQYSHWW